MLWQELNYKKRAIKLSPERLAKEFETFKVGPTIQLQNRKLSSSRLNVSSQIKQIANPAKLTGSLRVLNAEDKLDSPQSVPEIQVIEDPDYVEPSQPIQKVLVIEDPIASPDEKIDTDSDKEDDVDQANLEDALSSKTPSI